ncbi:MAG: hypothetical protein QXK06_05730 [Candidatus Diapherotrites archaeon]
MNTKSLLAILFLSLLFSSTNAFVLRTTAGYQILDRDALYNDSVQRDDTRLAQGTLFAKAGTKLYTLNPRHKADGKALLETTPKVLVNKSLLGISGTGQYSFELDAIEPTTYLRGPADQIRGRCSDRCDGPKVSLTVKDDGGYTQVAASNFIEEGREMIAGDYKYKITKIIVPEYKETWLKVGGDNQTWYLVLGQTGVMSGLTEATPKDIIVEFCVAKRNGAGWSNCYYDNSGSLTGELTIGESTPGTGMQPPGSPTEIGQQIEEATQTAAEQAEAAQGSTQVTSGKIPSEDEELAKCTADLQKSETLLVAKTRFKYDRAIGYPPGETGWNEFVADEIQEKKSFKIDMTGVGYRDAGKGLYEFYLQGFHPELKKFDGTISKKPAFATYGTRDGAQILCGHFIGLNEEMSCSPRDEIKPQDVIYKIYKFEGPFFEQPSEGKREILMKGPHCYDVWAYYMVKFRMDTTPSGGHEWWMKTVEEVQNYAESKKRGYNLIVNVVEEIEYNSQPISGAKVVATTTIEGESVRIEANTGEDGKAKLVVPINATITVVASKTNYVDSSIIVPPFSSTKEVTIALKRNLYNLKVAFARDDFWTLYYRYAPQHHGDPTTPGVNTADKAFLDSHVPTKEHSDYVYSVADKFLALKTKPCDDPSGETIPSKVRTDFQHLTIKDTRQGHENHDVRLYNVLEFENLKLDSYYYACYSRTIDGVKKTREIKWHIKINGVLEEPDPPRDI